MYLYTSALGVFSLQWNGFIPNKVQLLFSYTKGELK